MNKTVEYFAEVSRVLQTVMDTQQEPIEKASDAVAKA